MPENGFLMLAPVRHRCEKGLQQTLSEGGRVAIRFTEGDAIHFARFVLIPDPARGVDRQRLLFASDFDGPIEAHLEKIQRLTADLPGIWTTLEGFDQGVDLVKFMRRHAIRPDACYRAFPGTTLEALRRATKVHSAFQSELEAPDPIQRPRRPGLADARRIGRCLRSAWALLRGPFRAVSRGWRMSVELTKRARRHRFHDLWFAGLRIGATLSRLPSLRFINLVLENRLQPPAHTYSQADPGGVALNHIPEDARRQNELTLLTEVRPESLPRLRAVLALIDLYGSHLSGPGSLLGISTIHTVRWVLIDHGQRLLMVSNYDNSWEHYIDEFAEMILSGLDAIWSSAPDYPQAGAQDVAALKQFLRRHQCHAQLFHSAFDETSILNLKDSLEFATWTHPVLRFRACVESLLRGVHP